MWLLIVLTSFLFIYVRGETDTLVENIFDNEIQAFSVYCDSPRVNNPRVKKIVCNFLNTAARLGNASNFLETTNQQGGDLHLQINNCSRLLIASEFQTWRLLFSSLHLSIENVGNVFLEEMPSRFSVLRDSDLPNDYIKFSLKKSTMTTISSPLFSDTKTLLVDIDECQIDTISENTFQNVHQLWQLRIIKSNISRIERRAMPVAVHISPPTVGVFVEWTPFIFNATRIDLLETDAIHLQISEKDEHFNVVNSHFMSIRKGGLNITGTGHILIADSRFHQIENDAITVHLKGNDSEKTHKIMAYSTLTLMGLEVLSVNVTNFLLNLKITNGKVFLIRVAFLFPAALTSMISLDLNTIPHILDQNQTFIERLAVTCNCQDIGSNLLVINASSGKNTGKSENLFSTTGELKDNENDYEDGPPETTLATNYSIYQRVIQELNCYEDGHIIGLSTFNSLYCPDTATTNESETKIDHNATNSSVNNNDIKDKPLLLVWYFGIVGTIVFVAIVVVVLVCIVRQKKKSYQIDKRKSPIHRPNKQVGVISEDPFCECEDAEDESQL